MKPVGLGKAWGRARRSLLGVSVVACVAAASPAWSEADPVFLNDRATRLIRAGDLDAAIADLNEAIRLNPKLTSAYVNRGAAYDQKGDVRRALADFDAALAIEPNRVAYMNRGNAFVALGQHDRAIADYQAALKLQPLSSITLLNLAIAYREAGRYEEALRAVDHSYRLKTEPRAQVIRGETLLRMGDYAGAEAAYTKAIVTFRRYTEAYRDRAYARVMLGQHDLAMADADKAVELAPGRADVLNSRCWLRAMPGRELQRALADCDAALAQEPDSSAFLHSRAYAHLQAGSLPAAEADLRRAAELRPDNPDILFLAGVVKLRQGDEAGARADIARARAASPIVHRDYIGLDLPPWATGAS